MSMAEEQEQSGATAANQPGSTSTVNQRKEGNSRTTPKQTLMTLCINICSFFVSFPFLSSHLNDYVATSAL